jgi:3',5'-cyclic AMP phosphodiesterase CpdA
MDRTVVELNELQPDIVLCTGDLTEMGFRQDYLVAHEYLRRIECPNVVVVPGNHDARNVGYVHFEELVGPRSSSVQFGDVRIVGVDSTEPDLDYGQIGRARYAWLRDQFGGDAAFRIFMLHHHLLPIPGTGRERNMVYDAGDVLEVLEQCGVDLVLSGHKHVPYAWRLERLFVVNAGTCCSLRLRGATRPCYNVIRVSDDHVEVVRKFPFHGTEALIEFSPSTGSFKKYPMHTPEEPQPSEEPPSSRQLASSREPTAPASDERAPESGRVSDTRSARPGERGRGAG